MAGVAAARLCNDRRRKNYCSCGVARQRGKAKRNEGKTAKKANRGEGKEWHISGKKRSRADRTREQGLADALCIAGINLYHDTAA